MTGASNAVPAVCVCMLDKVAFAIELWSGTRDMMQVGDEVELKGGFTVRPFKTVHVIPSQGYLIYRHKKKLKDEFQGAGRDAIVAAKNSGIDVTTNWEVRASVPCNHTATHMDASSLWI